MTLTGSRTQNLTETTFTWVLSGGPVASLHVTGVDEGNLNPSHTEPTGWSFVGASSGDYSWETGANVTGTFTFTYTQLGTGLTLPTNASYDYFVGGSRVDVPITMTPEPGPSLALGLGLGGLMLRRRRRATP